MMLIKGFLGTSLSTSNNDKYCARLFLEVLSHIRYSREKYIKDEIRLDFRRSLGFQKGLVIKPRMKYDVQKRSNNSKNVNPK